MSSNSNDQGRAYEYAWINALYSALTDKRKTVIVENSSFEANKRAWLSMDDSFKELLNTSAEAAVDTIVELEPKIFDELDDTLFLESQVDGKGIKGDVRDIVIKRNEKKWEFGLSIKHNHEAIKHSRLSHKLDFGNEWFDMPCSATYWNNIKPIFEMLDLEKNKGTKWSDLDDKEGDVYVPLLNAFMEEVELAYKKNKEMPKKMVEYLIGINDYYKVISHDAKRLTIIRTFNTHDTLNKPGERTVSSISVPIVELPTELVKIQFKSGSKNTVEMYLNNGWQLSFRIHNASTKVETSLKFDIQFVGMPSSILTINCIWKEK